jgi:hypothetical protein
MALVIGVGFGPSTWGALRSVIFNVTLSGSPVTDSGDHNVEYVHGFKTTDGNGFVRTDYGALYQNAGSKQYGPNFAADITSGISAKFASEYQTSSVGMLINEDRAQLTGETVVLSSGSITMAASAFVSPFQTFTASSAPTINTIGKLTAF